MNQLKKVEMKRETGDGMKEESNACPLALGVPCWLLRTHYS